MSSETIKSLREFKRNPKLRGELKKPTSITLTVSQLEFIERNELNLSAIVRAKINELQKKVEKERKKNTEKISDSDDEL